MPGQGGPGDFAAGGMGGGLSAAVHAEYVVLQGSAYITMAEQLGTVSEVSSSSVTVKSSDGFTRSYALGSRCGGEQSATAAPAGRRHGHAS